MTSLFIDVVSSNLLVALIMDKELVHSSKIETNESKYASDLIIPKIEKLLSDNDLDYTHLDYVFSVV
jgi:tRNA A37 threonylcarbamoyladenosine modification protein TsaB